MAWLIIGVVLAGLIVYLVRNRRPKHQSICKTCGYIDFPKRMTKGSFMIEIILWGVLVLGLIPIPAFGALAIPFIPFFILPALIYSFWCLGARYYVCPKCNNPTMIPADSPIGQKMLSEQQDTSEKPN